MNLGDKRSARIETENVAPGVSRVRIIVNDSALPFVEVMAERIILDELWPILDKKMRVRLGLLVAADGRDHDAH